MKFVEFLSVDIFGNWEREYTRVEPELDNSESIREYFSATVPNLTKRADKFRILLSCEDGSKCESRRSSPCYSMLRDKLQLKDALA